MGRPYVTDDERPGCVRWHHEHPPRVDPMVIDQRAAVRLEPAPVQRLYFAVEAPIAQVTLCQDGEAISWFNDHNLRAGREPGETVGLAWHVRRPGRGTCPVARLVRYEARVGKMAPDCCRAHVCRR